MKNFSSFFRSLFPVVAAALIGAGLALSACAPSVAYRGNMVDEARMKEVIPGVHTRSDVLRILGSPTTEAPFTDKVWYYIGQETEKHGIFDPEVKKEKIVVVAFDDDGMVKSVKGEHPERIPVPIETAKTPTHGNEMTVMQQFLGNLGRFNPQTEKK